MPYIHIIICFTIILLASARQLPDFRDTNIIHLHSRKLDTRIVKSFQWRQVALQKRFQEELLRKNIYMVEISDMPLKLVLRLPFQVQYHDFCYEEDVGELRAHLAMLGAEPLDYIPHNTWTVYMSSEVALELRQHHPGVVKWVGELEPRDRIVTQMVTLLSDAQSAAEDIPGTTNIVLLTTGFSMLSFAFRFSGCGRCCLSGISSFSSCTAISTYFYRSTS
jgi:hypothetical protein